jgi:hypothetical protein
MLYELPHHSRNRRLAISSIRYDAEFQVEKHKRGFSATLFSLRSSDWLAVD